MLPNNNERNQKEGKEMNVFDVAKWCKADITGHGESLGFDEITENDVENIIETLEQNFDGQFGINWDTIEDAIKENMGVKK